MNDDASVSNRESVVTHDRRLEVHSSVVFKLGEDLISDEVQALVELVKNCYDADSPYARVTVDTTYSSVNGDGVPAEVITRDEDAPPVLSASNELVASPTEATGAYHGRITVEDGGTGMTLSDITRGWLTISNSLKREMKQSGRKTAGGRTPLGDKGLGRLGAQRLGRALEIVTVPKGSTVQYRVRIDWTRFIVAENLSSVAIEVVEEPAARPSGTVLYIDGLRDLNLWRADRLLDVQRELSTLISPYGGTRGFDVSVTVDMQSVDLREIPVRVREAAQLHYSIDYNARELSVHGKVRLSYFRPTSVKELSAYSRLVEADGGHAFLGWLMEEQPDQCRALGLRALGGRNDGWFAEFSMIRPIAEMKGHVKVATPAGVEIADPGPFTGVVDAVDLGRDQSGTFNNVSQYRQFVREINGVRIYRDGFGIRVDRDWLQLGKQWSSGSSYYNLKPENVIGYVDLTALGNPLLEETTDREGFKRTPYFQNFMRLMEDFRAFTERAQSFIRREYVQFRKLRAADAAGLEADVTPESISEALNTRLSEAQQQLATATSLRRTLVELEDVTDKEALSKATSLISRALRDSEEVQTYVAGLAQQREAVILLQQQLAFMREQLAMTYETVALGLTAEAFSHEVHNVADRLARRTAQIRSHTEGAGIRDLRLSAYFEHIRTSIAALNRQLTHLNPALRYLRERRESIDVRDFLTDVCAYYGERWRGAGIKALLVDGGSDFAVSMNRGKLTQVLDNLLLNSEYWLGETSARRAVYLEYSVPFIRQWDTGPGVDPVVEASIFEPFVTAKPPTTGRGLGLYVVQQLLESEGAEIRLLPDRNEANRRYRFEIEFTVLA